MNETPDIQINERVGGRRLSKDSGERQYVVLGTMSDVVARSRVEGAAPDLLGTLRRDDIDVDEIAGIAGGGFIATVRYSSPDRNPTAGDESRFTFETRGGTQRVTQSRKTVGKYGLGDFEPPDPGGINYNGDGYDGVDIVVPTYAFTETHYFDSISLAYKRDLFRLTGTVNNDAWGEFDAGECLFLGAAGSKRGENPWELVYFFNASPNMNDLEVGDISEIVKTGWDYLHVLYADMEVGEGKNKMLISKPVAAYTEQLYRHADFSRLGI